MFMFEVYNKHAGHGDIFVTLFIPSLGPCEIILK